MVDSVNPGLYTVGGTVQANEEGLYLSRRADRELLQLCEESTFAYVLTPRQMGKSSLMIRTAEQLIDAGKQAVIVDLTQLGTQLSADTWYSDFLDLVTSQLMLTTDMRQWWQANAQSGMTLRLTRFFQEVILAEVSEPIVIFVDEIDTTLSLDFTDDFYAAIRYLYVARSTDSRLRRLSFVLIGVATPADLIQDPKRTPFNIGQQVDLTDFTAEEASPLAAGLGLAAEKERQMLEEVLYWTGGHPYLTQRLCRALVDRSPQGWAAAAVGPVVAETFLGRMSEQDNNLQFVRDMLTKRAPKPLAQAVLTTYRDIYRGRQPVFDEEQNLVKSHLKLSGVVRREGKRLQVRNRIYREVFSPQWIRKHLPQSFWQRYKPVLQWAIPVMVASVLAMVVMAGLVHEAEQQKNIAQLREQAARAMNLLSTSNVASGEVLAIDTMDRSQAVPSVSVAAQSSLLKAVQVPQGINRLEGHRSGVDSVAFSPNGQRIVSGSEDSMLRLWDAQTGAAIGQPLKGHVTRVSSVAFSPDGQRIVSGSFDSTLRLWDAQTGAPIGQPLKGHVAQVYSVAFSPNGQRVVSGSGDGTLRLWDAQTGAAIGQPLEGHGGTVWSVAFSPDGQRIVSGSGNGTLRLWDARTGAAIGQPLEGHRDAVRSVAFSPDGQRIISGSADRTLRLWDAQTGAAIGQPLEGHGDGVLSVASSPDGQRIVSGSGDRTLRLWDAQTGAPIGQPLKGHVSWVFSVAFSPDGQHIVSGSGDQTLWLWDAQTSGPTSQPLEGHKATVWSVAFSPNSQRIASGSGDGTLRLWDVPTGTPIGQPLKGHRGTVYSVAFSPDGQRIVSGSGDSTLRLWDVPTGAPIGQPLEGHGDGVLSVAFSPDGQRIVSGSADRTLRLWDAQTGAPIGQPLDEGSWGAVRSVAFSPNGQRIVSGSDDGTLRLWDVPTGAPIGQPLEGHGRGALSVAFSPDGQRIVSGSADSTLRLWDTQTGAPISQPLEGHGRGALSVAFSPDGQRIVSGSTDSTLRLWDAQTGAPIGQPLESHGDKVLSVAFSPDGQHIVSGSADQTLRLWDASPEAWMDLACSRLQYHPLLNQPETITNDPEFIKVTERSKAVCEQRGWGHSALSSQVSTSWVESWRDRFIHRVTSLLGR